MHLYTHGGGATCAATTSPPPAPTALAALAHTYARTHARMHRFMSGVPSNVSKGKAPSKSSRKWGPPWGGSWVPWASRGDPETLSHDGADYNDDGDNSAAAPDVGAAAAAVAEAEAAAVSTARTAAAAAATISGTGGVEGGGGGGGGGEGRDTGEGEQQQQQPGRGTAAVKEGRWLPTELARFVRHLEDSIHRDGRSERPGARAGAASSAGSCVVSVLGAASLYFCRGQGRRLGRVGWHLEEYCCACRFTYSTNIQSMRGGAEERSNFPCMYDMSGR